MSEFAIRFPTDMFLVTIGLPVEDGAKFTEWVEALFAGFFGGPDPTPAANAITAYFTDAIADRKANPRDPEWDFISRMLRPDLVGDWLTEDDLLVICMTLMTAGLDTTRSALGYIFQHLARDEQLRHRLTAHPELVPKAVEEFVRLYPLVVQDGRLVMRDIDFHGLKLKKGDVLWLGIGSANRDPRKFPNPDEFDLDRPSLNHHLGFAAGPHRCLGMHLARHGSSSPCRNGTSGSLTTPSPPAPSCVNAAGSSRWSASRCGGPPPREHRRRRRVGGSVRTVQALRRRGYEAPITLVGAEQHPPYDRPPLSKDFLLGKLGADDFRLVEPDALAGLDVHLRLGVRATGLDAERREIQVGGDRLRYETLVIATGATARTLPTNLAGVHSLRTLDDAVAIRRALVAGARVAVVGGGFIGAELSSARLLGRDVTIIDPLPALMVRGLGVTIGGVLARGMPTTVCGCGSAARWRGSRAVSAWSAWSSTTDRPSTPTWWSWVSARTPRWVAGRLRSRHRRRARLRRGAARG